tara:strand:+ start:1506 stop:2282 length:777 start_codon:yes stop_codon:yes gene_type:complete
MFNVGDVVVAIETSSANGIVVGEEYKVIESRSSLGVNFIRINNGLGWAVNSERFKLKEAPKCSVGDEVRIIGPIRSAYGSVGDCGEVESIEEKGYVDPYRGRTYLVNGWWYGEDALELIKEEYKTPEGVVVKVGDVGVWDGYEYILVDGPNPRGEGGVHWKSTIGEWNPLSAKGYTIKQENVNKEKEMELTETVTETKIKEVLDGKLSNGACISTGVWAEGEIKLVVGAKYSAAYHCYFDKEALTELIEELTAVRDLL